MCPECKLHLRFIETSLGSIRGFTRVIFFIIQVSEDVKGWFFFLVNKTEVSCLRILVSKLLLLMLLPMCDLGDILQFLEIWKKCIPHMQSISCTANPSFSSRTFCYL